jgi:hypothetical protein
LDDLVAVARCLFEKDQHGRSNVAAAKPLTSAGLEATEKHLATATKRSTAVSAGASTATATAPSRTTIALGALTVFVFMKIVIHYFSLVL